ncbi:MAG TPA: hypothetical protein VMI74_17210 [Burkholderiales bacterium]|nr:hypothetical protein [Burkholderiales bacterium]
MRPTRITLVLALLALAGPGHAQVPPTMVASLGKQILQNIVFGSLKGELFGALADMGCKGSTIAGLAAAASTGKAGATRMLTSQGRGFAGGPVTMRAAGGGAGMPPTVPPSMAGMGAMDPATIQKMMETMQQQMGGRAPQMTPQQQAMMAQVMGQMQGAMAQPLSRTETAAVFDDLADLGLLNDKMRTEAKECIALAPPGAGDQLGATGAMLKSTVIPAAQDAKEKMAAASPEEQKQLADAMVEALNSASASDRKAFFDGLGLGFFPPAVVEQVRAQVRP